MPIANGSTPSPASLTGSLGRRSRRGSDRRSPGAARDRLCVRGLCEGDGPTNGKRADPTHGRPGFEHLVPRGNADGGRASLNAEPRCPPRLAPTTPTTMTLSVNGKSATATTAKPTNDDPNPLVVHYGTSLNIAVTANAPMPPGWKIEARHTGDVLSTGSGDYPVVCTVKSGASSCNVTRPPPATAPS